MTFRDMDVTAEPTGNVLAACHRSTCTNSLLQAIQNHESQRYRQRNKTNSAKCYKPKMPTPSFEGH
ncbi:hypothetical protein K0I73_16260 [Shewanella mesophila]|uniref:hypothetical protein n=1 Tax=Shewanella mesophila TaxID=2864208 RepID=UPI001C65A687|nr:hypothetical protein [Shewanella mesophila]QYJ85714.1 hypothetical protein K0I73_16260 [Shewanella mesophila]